MLDIHTHIIPGIDDGSEDMETSMIMAEMAVCSGVDTIIATPHSNQSGMFENYASDDLFIRMEKLKNEFSRENIDLNIGFGMEIFCTRDVPQLLKEKKLLTLNGSRYVLVEFAFGIDIVRMERMLYSILDSGYIPVIAHPERYYKVQAQPEIVFDWMQEGMGTQINKGSVFGRFGRAECICANNLLRNGLVTCIASDAHGVESRTTDMSEINEFLSVEYSEELADLLLTENPKRIFENKPLLSVSDIQLY